MEAELVTLATSGATTLVGLMATDLWGQVRERVAALFGNRAESAAEDLEDARDELLAAEDQDAARAAVAAEWAPRLRRALEKDARAVAELRALLAEFDEPEAKSGSVHNTISGGTFHQTVIQAGTIGDVRL